MNDSDKRALQRAYRDAKAKADALPNRLRDEDEQAEAEGREPFPVTPLTGIRADLVMAIIAAIEDAEPEIADIIAVLRKSCGKQGKAEVFLLAEQVAALIEAAGLEGVNA